MEGPILNLVMQGGSTSVLAVLGVIGYLKLDKKMGEENNKLHTRLTVIEALMKRDASED